MFGSDWLIAERRNSVIQWPAPGTEIMAIKKLKMNEANLRKAWEVSQRHTKEDWIEWIKWFSVEQLRESPSPALRCAEDFMTRIFFFFF
jgi:FKBP12-rapamycin complex-associated protein